ncbi:unnamed protein product [Polarella glacialis]|uniref:Uncharacterized protein n=2 Tax=Polarella glacialis TaxID=89957 RepID=A0A813HDH2_POLGL|nr:unnamed protein product [Polarella glacialis]|mmetsp:Transcript_25300/g.44927  ORF Transcript_25300/g.44927 Transcript_25300/m.44927 type:complete len:275 (+) Transcript_25300:50-874(+)
MIAYLSHAMGNAPAPAGQETSHQLFDEDGVTVIGSRSGPPTRAPESSCCFQGPQRWFDGPGPQMGAKMGANGAQRVAVSVLDAAGWTASLPDRTRREESGAVPQSSMGGAQLTVLNRSPHALRVSCRGRGKPLGDPVIVTAGKSVRMPVPFPPSGSSWTLTLQVTDPQTAAALCEMPGVPWPTGEAVGGPRSGPVPKEAACVLREMGTAICASLDYFQPAALARMAPPPPEAQPTEDEETPPPSPRTLALEQELMDALRAGNERGAQDLLARLR